MFLVYTCDDQGNHISYEGAVDAIECELYPLLRITSVLKAIEYILSDDALIAQYEQDVEQVISTLTSISS